MTTHNRDTVEGAIWVQSDPTPNFTSYMAVIHYNDDLTYPLPDEDTAVAYAAALLRAVAEAEYDAAVNAQMRTLADGFPQDRLPDDYKPDPAFIVNELRERRGGVKPIKAGPLEVTPGVSAYTGKPFYVCRIGEMSWQWDSADLKGHAEQVMQVGTAARLDGHFLAMLTDPERLGLDLRVAQAVVAGLAEYREP